MAVATKKVRATPSSPHPVSPVSKSASLMFRTYRDNGDSYHWEIVDDDSQVLAQSGGFASQGAAEHAARNLHQVTRSASFESQLVREHHDVAE